MDKKLKDKSFTKFLKKEGFYVVLFVCLCVVAVVAAVAAKNAKTVKEKPQVVEAQKQKDVKNEEKQIMPNATEASKTTPNVATTKEKPKDSNVSKPVANVNVTFTKPVEGIVVREYTNVPMPTEYGPIATHDGIDIQAKEGTPVYSAADGKVELVGENGFWGKFVTIKHANGKQVRYASLKNTFVKNGDTVTTKTKIGEVGNSATNYSMEKYGSHLWLQVFTIKDKVEQFENPISVFSSYKTSEKK